ncbi:unnamed protein product [Arabidopsis thaliana]|uniref:Uncharacterized protein n=1 Tax=Arabidopsis thaliana TaxID=3702 RepID=A0A5S9YBM5_ARATH|nr:unnamed protein product [Arabidopsis thaliana]
MDCESDIDLKRNGSFYGGDDCSGDGDDGMIFVEIVVDAMMMTVARVMVVIA